MLKKTVSILAVILLLVTAACSTQSTPAIATEPAKTEAPANTEAPPTPTQPLLQIALVRGSSTPGFEDIHSFLDLQAHKLAYQFVELDSLESAAVTESMKVIVIPTEVEGIGNIVSEHPATQFVVISDSEIPPAPNLHLIRSAEMQKYFMAGYIATQVEMDFRIGGLFDEGDPKYQQKQDAFTNGVNYFCGRCVSSYQPIKLFPKTITVPAGGGDAAYLAAFEEINLNVLKTVYVPPAGFGMTFLNELAARGIRIVTTDAVPTDMLPLVVATVREDYSAALESIWDQVVSDAPTEPITASIKLDNADPTVLNDARMRLVNNAIEELRQGWVVPLSVQP